MRKEDTGVDPAPAAGPPGSTTIFQLLVRKLFSALEKESIVGAVILFIMMLLTVADVVGRYFFKSPVQGALELTGLLLVCVASCALAYSQIKKGHIRVELITERLPEKARAILDVVAYFFCLFGSSMITWQTLIRAREYLLATRGNLTETLSIPLFPFLTLLGLGFLALALVSLVDFIQSLGKLIRK